MCWKTLKQFYLENSFYIFLSDMLISKIITYLLAILRSLQFRQSRSHELSAWQTWLLESQVLQHFCLSRWQECKREVTYGRRFLFQLTGLMKQTKEKNGQGGWCDNTASNCSWQLGKEVEYCCREGCLFILAAQKWNNQRNCIN